MNLKERLDERQRSDIEASHAYIQSHLPLRFSSSNEPQASESNLPLSTHTYVGTASDTHFFNTIKHAMSANLETSKYRPDTERYDQPDSLRGIPRIRKPLKLPSAKLCQQYLDIFFSTIHCAFPFLSRSTVEERLERISADGASDIDPSWTAQLSMSTPKVDTRIYCEPISQGFLFAIGACYTSLTESARLDDIPHQQYFAQGLLFFDEMYSNSSLQNVSLILTQCFYLLATCQTDRYDPLLLFLIDANTLRKGLEHPRPCHPHGPKPGFARRSITMGQRRGNKSTGTGRTTQSMVLTLYPRPASCASTGPPCRDSASRLPRRAPIEGRRYSPHQFTILR